MLIFFVLYSRNSDSGKIITSNNPDKTIILIASYKLNKWSLSVVYLESSQISMTELFEKVANG